MAFGYGGVKTRSHIIYLLYSIRLGLESYFILLSITLFSMLIFNHSHIIHINILTYCICIMYCILYCIVCSKCQIPGNNIRYYRIWKVKFLIVNKFTWGYVLLCIFCIASCFLCFKHMWDEIYKALSLCMYHVIVRLHFHRFVHKAQIGKK